VTRICLLLVLLTAACAPLPPRGSDTGKALDTQAAPPVRNVTGFSDALRCMDQLYLSYGVRDVSVVVEDISDATKKVSAGARDMTMSAISDMTRRSRAIQVISFGQDANNIVAFLNNARDRSAFSVVPQYDLRGSVSQFDEGVVRRQADGGFSLSRLLGFGGSTSRQVNVLGLDLALADTVNLALVPGVVSKNVTTLIREGDALDAEATFSKVGVNFSTSFQRTDGTAQALRNMIELASVELFGRLLKLPYWTCIGVGGDNEEVRKEVEDWFIGMEHSGELTAFFQEQLRNRGFFDGPADGRVTPALRQAVGAYRNALGMGSEGLVDLAFFARFLEAPPPPRPAGAYRDVPATAAAPLSLQAQAGKAAYAPGEAMSFQLATSAPAYAYCYARDPKGIIQRIFPNRYRRDPSLRPGVPLVLPGDQPFQLAAPAAGQVEVACFAAPREIYNDVPAALKWGDFQNLNKVASFDDIRRELEAVAGERVAEARLALRAEAP